MKNHQIPRETEKVPKNTRKGDAIRYLMIVPLIFLAVWLLQKSFWFKGDEQKHKQEERELAYLQQEKLKEIEEDRAQEKEDNFRFNIDINGEDIVIENEQELENFARELEHNL